MAGTDLIADLEARNLIHDSTDREALRDAVGVGPVAIYYGCDPTADSLHVGNLIGLIMLRRFQDAGHRPIALAGGATGMVGDPSGRSDERNLLDDETLNHNVAAIKAQLATIVDLDDGISEGSGDRRGQLVDNRDWTQPITVLEFLRDVGKHVTVNQMLARESIKLRVNSEHGISFTEFSYMLLQANDYLWLHDNLGCTIQIGGSDQWGNIIAGVDLIRRKRGAHVHAFSWPLLTAADGSKLGKTTGARVWLDAEKTSPYQFRQHWMQTPDELVQSQLLTFSLEPVEQIRAIVAEHADAPQLRLGQRALADEMTALVHGASAAGAAAEAADVLFAGDPASASVEAFAMLAAEIPSSRLAASDLGDLVGVFVRAGLASSNGDARRSAAQRSFYANGVQLDEDSLLSDVELVHGRYLLLRKGKKSHHLLEIFS
jgi:tyrosyl-tRNA synthetase